MEDLRRGKERRAERGNVWVVSNTDGIKEIMSFGA